jgi:hypothetical protein
MGASQIPTPHSRAPTILASDYFPLRLQPDLDQPADPLGARLIWRVLLNPGVQLSDTGRRNPADQTRTRGPPGVMERPPTEAALLFPSPLSAALALEYLDAVPSIRVQYHSENLFLLTAETTSLR